MKTRVPWTVDGNRPPRGKGAVPPRSPPRYLLRGCVPARYYYLYRGHNSSGSLKLFYYLFYTLAAPRFRIATFQPPFLAISARFYFRIFILWHARVVFSVVSLSLFFLLELRFYILFVENSNARFNFAHLEFSRDFREIYKSRRFCVGRVAHFQISQFEKVQSNSKNISTSDFWNKKKKKM